MHKYTIIIRNYSLNIYSTLKLGTWRILMQSRFAEHSNCSSSFIHCGILTTAYDLLKIYRGVGYGCLALAAINAGRMMPHR